MNSLNERLSWQMPFRLTVSLCGLIPLVFGAAWTWTFGFTSYRSHLAFIGLPLGLGCIFLGIGMLLMRRWAIYLSILLSTFAALASVWVASISHHWFYWLLSLVSIMYSVAISRRALSHCPNDSHDNSRNA